MTNLEQRLKYIDNVALNTISSNEPKYATAPDKAFRAIRDEIAVIQAECAEAENVFAVPECPTDLLRVQDRDGVVWGRYNNSCGIWTMEGGGRSTDWTRLITLSGPVKRAPVPPIEIPAERLDPDALAAIYRNAYYAGGTSTQAGFEAVVKYLKDGD